ncbi:MAG TPA: hypothetical protein VGC91_09370 [Pyrinomonadaceae bacterium]|jgi:hypothetical protein
MSTTLTPTQTQYDSWVIEMTPEMAQAAHVPEGSYIVLQLSAGQVSVEILPPASPEMKEFVQRIGEKYKDAFAELKRLGD